MSDDPRLPNPAPLYTDPPTVGLGTVAIARPETIAPEPIQDGEAARVSVEVCGGQAERIYQLEKQVEALSKQIDSIITTLARTFGSGQAAIMKVK